MKTDTLDLGKLARTLRALSYDLDALGRRGVPTQEAIVDTLRTLGPRSAYALRRILRRSQPAVYAGLRALEAEGRIRRARHGWTLTEPGARAPETPPVDLQIGIKAL